MFFSTDLKTDLTDNQTLRYFRVDVNKDGYWKNSHTRIQLEGVINHLSILYPNFDYFLLYDQSSGHTKVMENGLLVGNMNMTYGGAVSLIHETTVGEIGPHPSMLKVGEHQFMLFTDRYKGPFWLKYMDKVLSQMDISHDGSHVKEKPKTQLLVNLRCTGVDTTSR